MSELRLATKPIIIGFAGNPIEGFRNRLKGDVNRDGVVDLQDAILVLQFLSGQTSVEIRADYVSSGIDVDGNNRISAAEALYAVQAVAGLRAE